MNVFDSKFSAFISSKMALSTVELNIPSKKETDFFIENRSPNHEIHFKVALNIIVMSLQSWYNLILMCPMPTKASEICCLD